MSWPRLHPRPPALPSLAPRPRVLGHAHRCLQQCSQTGPRDCIIGAVSLASIPPGEAGEQPNKRKGSPPDEVGDTVDGDGKRIKRLGNGGGSDPIPVNDVRQLQLSNEETHSLLFSCHPTGAASGKILDPSGSRQNVQQISSFKLERTKHKIFLSHSGIQKDFVDQLCVDLEARGYLFPFFDQRYHSLPKGKDFVALIKEAAQLCHVAIIVLSKEFLCSKWPMIELAEFHAAQEAGNQKLNMFPLFYKLSVDDLADEKIEDCWMPKWIGHANKDETIDVKKWSAAVSVAEGKWPHIRVECNVGDCLQKGCCACLHQDLISLSPKQPGAPIGWEEWDGLLWFTLSKVWA